MTALLTAPSQALGPGRATSVVVALVALAILGASLQLAGALPPARWWTAAVRPDRGDAAALVFHFSRLPRLATAALCGAGLAVAGTLTQTVLRNPLAVPGTLGVTAAAQLALLGTTLVMPAGWGIPPAVAALAGGFASLAIVLAVAARDRFSTVTLLLAGLAVSLFATALGGLLVLFNHEALGAAALWSAGSLAQDSWSVPATLLPRLAVLAVPAVLLLRPMALLALPDASARALGLSPGLVRVTALGLAVALSASVTAAVGVVGFVDLAAPLVVRLAGARHLATRLVLAALTGAALLVLVDTGVQAIEARTGGLLPTGAATGVLAAPLLLTMLYGLRVSAAALPRHASVPRAARPRRALVLLAAGGVLAAVAALLIGRTGSGWAMLAPDNAAALLPWRAPRTGVAFAAGAALATAGALLQRCFNNPLASPESLGIGSAVVVAFAAVLLVDPTPSAAALATAGLGAGLALGLLMTAAAGYARATPDRLLLTGTALGAGLSAGVATLLALNDPRAAALSSWTAGSTAAADGPMALLALLGAAVAVPSALLLARPLDLLSLGEPVARAVGLPVRPARLAALVIAALLTTGGVLVVGPLTFVGLLGPHLASRMGLNRSATHIPGAALAGGLVLVLADWLGRIAIAPFDVPAGLSASLLGIPVLIVLLGRRAPRA